ncbi:MAG TPA: EAL domain-containing protein [Pyrinomonadaceae bacterium]|nr:EAL domain-containing protein [Pyrinomonadaceae bacterium]
MAEPGKRKPTLLIIDDDDQIRTLLTQLLGGDNDCTSAESAEAALKLLAENSFDLVISDINMSGISGLEFLPTILSKSPDTVVIMVSGQQTIDYAIEAMRAGAFDYITKPFDIPHIEAAVSRALSHRRLLDAKRGYENHLEEMVNERTAEIEHLAYYDRLTDLPNRTLFVDRYEKAIASSSGNDKIVGVMLISLDRFKNINDTLGHVAGDRLLQDVAARLQSCISNQDTVARFEGPEFAVLLIDSFGPVAIEAVSVSILDLLKKSFSVARQEVYVTASIGISLFPHNGDTATTILQNAGAALHRAKRLGGNNHQFYATDMNASARNRLALETSLRQAIDNDEFVTFYQPVVNLASGKIVGLEALVRWQHPRLGILPPADFLELAEHTGLIMDISQSVMRAACLQTRQWQLQGQSDLRLAVNVSARQFRQKDFIDRIRRILNDTSFNPASLELELTETSIMDNPESAAEILAEIRNLGITVAIDDFGTGYSSLSYLKKFPIDTLKVDRSFVSGAAIDRDDASLVTAIIRLAHDLRLKVVAEGIETEDELAFLRQLKCDEGQGYFFGKPQPADILSRSFFQAEVPDSAISGPTRTHL